MPFDFLFDLCDNISKEEIFIKTCIKDEIFSIKWNFIARSLQTYIT